ncbi:MAG: thermonuclease NucI, partial [Culicoidibacterales bacterium]
MQKQNTKKLVSAIVIILVLLLSYCISEFGLAKQNTNQEMIQLERCVDGDTFVASTKKFGSTKIRLSGVNTPEISHPGYGIKEEHY